MKFNFFRKKKVVDLVIKCEIDSISINDKPISFPTKHTVLTDILGEPDRTLIKTKNYIFWDKYGVFCGYTDENNILSINAYQNKEDKSIYNTKNQFKGKLFLNDKEITNSEFGQISLGKFALRRLGRDHEFRFGFNLGVSTLHK